MAITRKPKPPRSSGPVDVEALINKGGSVVPAKPDAAPPNGAAVVPIVLRLPSGMLGRIDAAVRSRPVKMTRHTWILEAIVEQLAQQE